MPGEHTGSDGVTTTWSINENDYQFVLAVMQEMNAKYGQYFDQNRIFAFGHSQGGSLTNYLSERDPNLFTAYAVNAGGGRNFPAGTPPAPMYGIYGEYDSVSIASGRTGWFTRNNLNVADGVITDPFDLPARFDNPIQYLIYPDTPQYPGNKFVTTLWYDASGIPMFGDTLAYGREHNNTVPDARRIWTQWFSHWGRDAGGNRVYANVVSCVDVATVKGAMGAQTGQPNYVPTADMDKNGVIDAIDVKLARVALARIPPNSINSCP